MAPVRRRRVDGRWPDDAGRRSDSDLALHEELSALDNWRFFGALQLADALDVMTWRGLGFQAALLPTVTWLGFATLFGAVALARFR